MSRVSINAGGVLVCPLGHSRCLIMLVELMNGAIVGFLFPKVVLHYSMKLCVYQAGFEFVVILIATSQVLGLG